MFEHLKTGCLLVIYSVVITLPVSKLSSRSRVVVFPSLVRSWTTETPTTRFESCCKRGHFFRAVQTMSMHLFTDAVGDVVEHAREDNSVWKTLGYVFGLRHEILYLVQYLQRCVCRTYVPFNLNSSPPMSLLFLQLSLFMTDSAFLHLNFDALVESSEPEPMQKTESEQTCTLAVNVLPIGSSSNK